MLLGNDERIIMLSYICNPEQVERIRTEETTNGTYHFIRKNGEKIYFAYRKVETKVGHYFVKVNLPKELFNALIKSGQVAKYML